jgi:pyrroloquinoline-quinone synthase
VGGALWDRIEERCERWNVLRHPFYARWSEGELTREDLARYAGQYRHAVQALADMTAAAAEQHESLRKHADEEAAHVELWDDFAKATGNAGGDHPTLETRACVGTWCAEDGLLPALARMYAIERAQPEIARVKREGLVDLYGFEAGPATAYFELHERLDLEHAAEVRELIEELAVEADEHALLDAAEAAVRANWRLLDGVATD